MSLSIADASRLTGLAASAIRYYEDQGLVRPARLPNGRREFDEASIRDLVIINDLRQSGMTLADLRKFQAKRRKNGMCRDLVEIARERASSLRRQINALRLAEGRLNAFALTCGQNCGEAEASTCAVFS